MLTSVCAREIFLAFNAVITPRSRLGRLSGPSGGKWDNRAGREGKPMGRPEKIRLGDTLVAQNIISPDQLKVSLEQQKKTGRRLGRGTVEQGLVNEEPNCAAVTPA